MLRRIYSEILQLYDWIDRKVTRFRYQTFDILWQKIKLRNYTSGILKVEEFSPLPSDDFCIFVYYEPDGYVSNSVKRVLGELKKQNVNVLLSVNSNLSELQLDYFSNTVQAILYRNNQGFDFGSYKDSVRFLKERGDGVRRLLFLNDSVFYASTGLPEMIASLLKDSDAVALFENWGEGYHLQSFGFSVSSDTFNSGPFTTFWRDYIPVNNRLYAIESGEKELSRAILAGARSSEVIYTAAKLRTPIIDDADFSIFENLRTFAHPWRGSLANLDKLSLDEFLADKVIEFINVTSPIHAGAYLFPKYMLSPVYKKDLVYRGRFSFWEIENWLPDVMPDDEAEEYLTLLRKKGDSSSLSTVHNKQYKIGVK